MTDSPLTVRLDFTMDFKERGYEPSYLFEGSFRFNKHYFPRPGELRQLTPGAKADLTEEVRCALHLDSLPEVEFWVRNLANKSSSFRLQTSTDWFYPDFVCQLKDGRILVVEYKGQGLYTADDAKEKRALGEVWESRSNGRCLFVMPTNNDFSVIDRKVRGTP